MLDLIHSPDDKYQPVIYIFPTQVPGAVCMVVSVYTCTYIYSYMYIVEGQSVGCCGREQIADTNTEHRVEEWEHIYTST